MELPNPQTIIIWEQLSISCITFHSCRSRFGMFDLSGLEIENLELRKIIKSKTQAPESDWESSEATNSL